MSHRMHKEARQSGASLPTSKWYFKSVPGYTNICRTKRGLMNGKSTHVYVLENWPLTEGKGGEVEMLLSADFVDNENHGSILVIVAPNATYDDIDARVKSKFSSRGSIFVAQRWSDFSEDDSESSELMRAICVEDYEGSDDCGGTRGVVASTRL